MSIARQLRPVRYHEFCTNISLLLYDGKLGSCKSCKDSLKCTICTVERLQGIDDEDISDEEAGSQTGLNGKAVSKKGKSYEVNGAREINTNTFDPRTIAWKCSLTTGRRQENAREEIAYSCSLLRKKVAMSEASSTRSGTQRVVKKLKRNQLSLPSQNALTQFNLLFLSDV